MKKLFLLLAVIPFLTIAQTNDTTFLEFIDYADSAYSQDSKSIAAYQWYIKAIIIANDDELVKEEYKYYMGPLFSITAEISFSYGMYDYARSFYIQALAFHRLTNNEDGIVEVIPKMALCYQSMRENNVSLPPITAERLETAEVYFKIIATPVVENGQLMVKINAGIADGIYPNAVGTVYAAARSPYESRANTKLGDAKIIQLDTNFTLLMVENVSVADSFYHVYAGDMVLMLSKIPVREYNSVLWQLAQKQVVFLNLENEPLYDIRQLMSFDSQQFEDEILEIMRRDVYQTYEWLDGLEDKSGFDNLMVDIATSGKYAGKTGYEVMKITTKEDVLSFLNYVNSYPGKYMAHDFKINETYATWVINNCPIGFDEFLEQVMALQTNAAFEDFTKKNRDALIVDDYQSYLNVEAEELAAQEKFAEATEISQRAIILANYLNEPYHIGWAHFSRARVFEMQNASPDSVKAHYETALFWFEKAQDEKGKSYCLNNLASFYEDLDQYKKAKEFYSQAYRAKLLILKATPKDRTAIYYSLSKSASGIGNMNYVLANYDSSIVAYNNALLWADSANNLQSKTYAARLQTDMARIYKKRGQYDFASKLYADQVQRYLQLGDNEKVADAYDNEADVLFSKGDYEGALEKYDNAIDMKLALGKWSDAGFSMSNCAQAMWNLGDLDSAVALHTMALAYREKENDRLGTAFSVAKIAELYKELGRPELAKSYYNQALEIYQENGDTLKVAEIANDIGIYFTDLKNYSRANAYFAYALEVYEKRAMKSEIALVFANQAFVYGQLRDFTNAKKMNAKSLKIRKEINERQNIMYSLVDLSINYMQSDYNFDTALVMLEEALLLANETGSTDYEAYCYHSMGNAYALNAKTGEAETYFRKALTLYKKNNNVLEQCRMFVILGANEMERGAFENAISYYKKAETVARQNDLRAEVANAYNSMAEYFYYTGEFQKSFAVIDSSYQIYTEINNPYGLASTYLVDGNTHNLKGDAPAALKAYATADSIYGALKDPLSQATAMNNTATINFFQGDYNSALVLLNQCLKIFDSTQVRSSLLNSVYTNLGEIYMEKGIWEESEKWLQKGILLAQEMGATRQEWGDKTIFGKLLYRQEKYSESAELLKKCYNAYIKSDEKMAMAEAATSLGKAYRKLGDLEKSKKYFTEALHIFRKIGSKKMIWEPLFELALIEQQQQHTLASVAYLKEAVDTLEMLSNDILGNATNKKMFAKANDKKNIYQTLITQLVAAGDVKMAWAYQEKLNVYGLEEQTRGDGKRGAGDANAETFALSELEFKVDGIYTQLMKEKAKSAEQRSTEKIAELEKRMTVASENYQNFFWDLVDNGVISNDFSNSINPEQLDQMRFDLDEDIIVLEYLVTDHQLIIFAASADTLGAKVIEISKESVEKYVNGYYNLLMSQAEFTLLDRASEELYNLLIAPILPMVKNKKKIAFIPTGILYKLPFQSLGTTTTDALHYLVEDFQIFYLNDIRSTVNATALDASGVTLLAFGNADATLEFAEKEVGMIRKTFPGAVVYVKKDAREDLAKTDMNKFKIVHFATHGNLDPINFNNSYLTMAPNMELGEDGRLTMSEINRLRTLRDCQLIVLSACNTAVNDENLDGWVNNPAKAFLRKGAKSAVASLWSVDDAATGLLMQHFYENLKNGMSKLEALTSAQKTLVNSENFGHPYFWAAFELMGQWN